jgi:hypothetical protein
MFYYFEERNLIMEIDELGNIFFKLQDLNLKTMEEVGLIVKETSKDIIDKLLEYCENTGFTVRRLYILANELNRVEVIIKDVLQYYNYFIIRNINITTV